MKPDEPAEPETPVPTRVRTPLVHGYVQMLATSLGVDLLHLKGAAVDPSLSHGQRVSVDVDVLVRPRHVDAMMTGLQRLGWQPMAGFAAGSAFGHAVNLRHDLGLVDLHRSWPGFDITPEAAFDLLWRDRDVRPIAQIDCAVPSVPHQRLLLVSHHGRSHGARVEDLDMAWSSADDIVRQRILADARRFDARLALAAGTGDLEAFRHQPGYRLWKHFSGPEQSRWHEWVGRFGAARGLREKARVTRMFLSVNQDLVRQELGHDPGPGELMRAATVRTLRAVRALRALRPTAGDEERR